MNTVMLTAIGSASAQTVIECLHAMGYRVVGCDIYAPTWHVECQMVDAFWQAPRIDDADQYVAQMMQNIRAHGADFLIPLTDVEMDILAPIADRLQSIGCTLCAPSADVVALCRNKTAMASLLSKEKIGQTIPTFCPYQHTFDEKDFPLMLKPNSGRSSMGQMVVSSQQALEQALTLRNDYIAQPYLSGDVWTVDVARDANGHCQTVVRQELLRTGNGLGMTVQTYATHPLQVVCAQIADCIHLVGVVNMEFIEHGDQFAFLEVNPRFSGGIGFSLVAGCNLTDMMLRCAKGESISVVETQTLTIAKKTTFVVTK